MLIAITLISLVCSGCTKGQAGKAKNDKAQNPPTHLTKEDGEVISMKKVKLPFASSSMEAYRMMYWSDGLKNEAYVATPKGPGTYSLFVECHGGYTTPMNISHLAEIPGEGETVTFDTNLLAGAYSNFITVAPTYRGYGNSEGQVKGIYENTIDTENAIKAIMNYFNNKKENRHIKDILYLDGWSMGGAVVLRIASKRDDVKSVVANSPFVGWNTFDTWAQNHLDNEKVGKFYYDGVDAYGSFDPDYDVYKKQSVPYESIKAPTLLVQGNDDQTVPWQSVQFLYDKMKANHQDVTFKIIDGGNHGLTNKWDEWRNITNEWYSKH